MIKEGYRFFGTGGALGFDTLAAQSVLDLKMQYPQIKLILVLPCRAQEKYWKKEDRELYLKILQNADKAVYISQEYTPECMQKRNRHLVDHSSVCISYLIHRSGGTFYTVNYAVKQGLRVIDLAK